MDDVFAVNVFTRRGIILCSGIHVEGCCFGSLHRAVFLVVGNTHT